MIAMVPDEKIRATLSELFDQAETIASTRREPTTVADNEPVSESNPIEIEEEQEGTPMTTRDIPVEGIGNVRISFPRPTNERPEPERIVVPSLALRK